jgi:hypothetical protein
MGGRICGDCVLRACEAVMDGTSRAPLQWVAACMEKSVVRFPQGSYLPREPNSSLWFLRRVFILV